MVVAFLRRSKALMCETKYLIVALAVASMFVIDSAALARGPGGSFGGGGPPAWSGSHPPGFSRGQKVGWHGKSVPPGWSKGRKTGWHDSDVPLGLYGR
jgi:hypothetical protein